MTAVPSIIVSFVPMLECLPIASFPNDFMIGVDGFFFSFFPFGLDGV